MKYLNMICAASVLIAACTSNGTKTENKDADKPIDSAVVGNTTNAASDTSRCFILTEGKSSRDTTTIELAIKGEKVTGQMNWLPYQKDSRRGPLKGTFKGDTITAVWSFMQEGTRDSIDLKFKMATNQLTQKPLKVNTKTGREETDEAAGYTVVYRATDKGKK